MVITKKKWVVGDVLGEYKVASRTDAKGGTSVDGNDKYHSTPFTKLLWIQFRRKAWAPRGTRKCVHSK